MKKMFLLLSFMSAVFVSCEPEDCDDCKECDTGEESMTPLQSMLVDATENGTVVRIFETEESIEFENANDVGVFDGMTVGFANPFWATAEFEPIEFEAMQLIDVSEVKLALVTCPALGLPSPTYDWFCEMTHPTGHAIANDSAEPTMEDIQVYDESPSVAYPDDMTFKIYFSQGIYPNHAALPYQSLRGQLESWGAGWANARVDWCTHPVHTERCVTAD